ncbi:hypothetical protein DICPUDRAFT_84762 [Dictyostelium purpureum]|uniref:Uncharacterized protein n=1 Tax=Dictyostelium purpureum TaxID=5786 RepID=F1A3N4_DICPU|nr:uncharacterized protein DICPUDRAFT_84762 [Dictyostelium purpureum]EGC29195.1 hypothetical protein DICPUDRAFT_84762 [Dictyostelium purpureum]|eukprot:XP_003294278.1 hypothetical protein DICPUDRAFT_84762 [Dictyostelium purpureum]
MSLLKYGTIFTGVGIQSIQVKVQTSNENTLGIIQKIIKNENYRNNFFIGIISSFGSLIATTNVRNLVFKSIDFFVKDNEPLLQQRMFSILEDIKSRPIEFLICVLYSSGVRLIQIKTNTLIQNAILGYYMENYKYIKQFSTTKKYIIKALYYILSKPLVSCLLIAFLNVPFKNISAQYCKKFLESSKNEITLIKSNPISITIQLLKEKGFIGAFYTGMVHNYLFNLSGLLNKFTK